MKSVIAEDLVKTYRNGAVRALDHLSLDVEEGTVLSVLGPNGAGKTTCVRILATLLRPDSGRAMVGGIDVIKHPEKVREVIGLSGQYAAVDEILEVWIASLGIGILRSWGLDMTAAGNVGVRWRI